MCESRKLILQAKFKKCKDKPINLWEEVDNMQENEIIEKLNLIISKLKDFPDLFKLRLQNNTNIPLRDISSS